MKKMSLTQRCFKTTPMRDLWSYSVVVNRLRSFFLARGYIEVHTQHKLSILAACEDPHTIRPFRFTEDVIWPLPQTGQMWLEHHLLRNPTLPGVFCVSTSYRDEPNPIPRRHDFVFPMFEFESHGTIDDLISLEKDLLRYLDLKKEGEEICELDYLDAEDLCCSQDIGHREEKMLCDCIDDILLLRKFPLYTHPFWNMKVSQNISHKVDVLIDGQETIGSAERSCDKEDMRRRFYTLEDGQYAEKLFGLFGEKRVGKELNDFLSHDFFPRFGGGIGLKRLIDGMGNLGVLQDVADCGHFREIKSLCF